MKRFLVIFLILLFQCSFPYALSANSTIKVGVYNNEPLLFADADGKGKGIFADIIEYVASKEGWQIEYVTGTWDQCLSRLENNQIDILGTIAHTMARDKLYDFGRKNLMTNWGQLYTMEQALKNLLSNAIKYFPDGGVIRVVGKVIDFGISNLDFGSERKFDNFGLRNAKEW